MAGRTRRSFLRAGCAVSIGALAGCGGDAGGPTPADPSTESPIRGVDFDGGDLVVDLREGHTVSELTLIGPDGRAFTEVDVSLGETRSHLGILDIRPGLGGYEHYDPGECELVAASGGELATLDLELVPELRITDVRQYREGERNADYGKLAVTVENVGTGPTWVYDITYRNAPNFAANNDLVSDPGIPQLEVPETTAEMVIEPEEVQTFVGPTPPLLFADESTRTCDAGGVMSVIAGGAYGGALEIEISTSVGGDILDVGLVDRYTCSDVSVEIGDGR